MSLIPLIQIIGVFALVAFLVAVTIGEDLAIAAIRIKDSFHPLDRELRLITERVRKIH